MSIEEAIQGGIVFKGKKDKPKEEEKVKTKAKKATYIKKTGQDNYPAPSFLYTYFCGSISIQ